MGKRDHTLPVAVKIMHAFDAIRMIRTHLESLLHTSRSTQYTPYHNFRIDCIHAILIDISIFVTLSSLTHDIRSQLAAILGQRS